MKEVWKKERQEGKNKKQKKEEEERIKRQQKEEKHEEGLETSTSFAKSAAGRWQGRLVLSRSRKDTHEDWKGKSNDIKV